MAQDTKITETEWFNACGIVYARSEKGIVSFDIFDASEWNGPAEEGEQLADFIAAAPATAAELVRVKASNAELVEALKGIIEHRVVHQHLCECGQPECKTTKARTALVNASPHEDPDAMIGCADDKGD